MATANGKKKPRPFKGRGFPDPNAHPASFSLASSFQFHAPAGGATISTNQLFQFTRLPARQPAYSANNLFVLHGFDYLGLRLVYFGQLKQNLFILIQAPFGATLASDSELPPPTTGPCGPTDLSKINFQHYQYMTWPIKKQEIYICYY